MRTIRGARWWNGLPRTVASPQAGDVFGTGTVGGGSIGESIRKGYEKARFLLPGDVVEIEVEGIGLLRGTITPKEHADAGYRYMVKVQPSLPERGIAKDYKYELKLR